MIPMPILSRNEVAAAYLQQLHELAFEITTAMEAISENDLMRFQECVARQETICFGLIAIAKTVSECLPSPEPLSVPNIDPSIRERIRSTGGAINQLNMQYAELLKHSGRSIALLGLLSRSQTEQFLTSRRTRPKYETWSCEM